MARDVAREFDEATVPLFLDVFKSFRPNLARVKSVNEDARVTRRGLSKSEMIWKEGYTEDIDVDRYIEWGAGRE